MNEGLGVAFNHRRTARRLALLAAISALFVFASSAGALDGVVDPPAVDTTASDATAQTTVTADPVPVTPDPVVIAPDPIPVTPDPVVIAPDPIPVTPDPVVIAPDPIPVTPDPVVIAPDPIPVTPDPVVIAPDPIPVTPDPVVIAPDPIPVTPDPVVIAPDPVVTVTPTPVSSAATDLAPQDVILAVHGASPVTGDAANISAAGSDSPSGTVRVDVVESAPVGLAGAGDVPVLAAVATEQQATEKPSVITPLVVPIVQTLAPGLLTPYASPQTFGTEIPTPGAVPAAGANAPATSQPAQASAAASGLPFGIALPTGGWSGESAGILALLMGLLPLGLPDGKSKMGGQTQLAVLLLGGLLMLIRFFASPVRDERRRGPRGFAALALRPG